MEKNKIIESIDTQGFTADLMNFIFDHGLGTYSKTDIYDYIVYLANKHSHDSFFDTNSNFDNAVLLKVSETRIKNTRQNIALKFKGEERHNVYIDFLSKLQNGQTKVIFEDEEVFTFFIEDPFIRMTLESLLKKHQGITIDYSFNRELVKIKRIDFLTLLIAESANGNKDEFVKALQKPMTAEKFKILGIKTYELLIAKLASSLVFELIVKTSLTLLTKL